MQQSPAMDITLYEDVNMTTSLPSKGSSTPPPLPPFSLTMDKVNLHLASPELESFSFHPRASMEKDGLSSMAVSTPTRILFPRSVTEEQEEYARGFVEALSNIHRSQGARAVISGSSPPSQGAEACIGGINRTQGAEAFIGGINRTQGVGAFNADHASTPRSVNQAPAGLTYTTLTTIKSKGTPSGPATSTPTLHGSSRGTLSGSITTTPTLHGSSNQPQISLCGGSYNTSDYAETKQQSWLGGGTPSLASNRLIQLKEEPQTVPCLGTTPPISPLRVDVQEHIKVERKRERNREAARKCRNKKLEQISRLETRVRELTDQNMRLAGTANALRDELGGLRREIMEHRRHGCQVIYDQTQPTFSVAPKRISTLHPSDPISTPHQVCYVSDQLSSAREGNLTSNQFTSLRQLNYSPRSSILQSTSPFSSS